MENRKFCPIEEALLRIQASAPSTTDLLNALYFFQRTISNVLTHPNDWTLTSIDKENDPFIQKLLNWGEARQFLGLLGFNDKDGVYYEHAICDESMKFLEATLRIVNTHIHDLKIAFIEEKQCFGEEKMVHHQQKGNMGCGSTTTNCKLKEMLSRHLKGDRVERGGKISEWKSVRRERETGSAPFVVDAAGGYFYQTGRCGKMGESKKRRKCFFAEMFDKHDFNGKQKGPAFFSFLNTN